MPRVKGSPNVSTLIKQGKLPAEAKDWSKAQRDKYMAAGNKPAPIVDSRTDAQILEDLRGRFDVYARVIRATARDMVTASIVSGSAGIGKTHLAEQILQLEKERRGSRVVTVKGTISALDLYELAYNNSRPGDVILLDDADRILYDEEGLNILKALLDSSTDRLVTWMTDHPRFKGESGLPKSFYYRGSVMFLTNLDMQRVLDEGKSRNLEHLEALMSRCLYIDLKVHDRREVGIWITHMTKLHKILQGIGLSAKMEQLAIEWVTKHREDVRELSLRTILKLGRCMLMSESKEKDVVVDWEQMARMTLLRTP